MQTLYSKNYNPPAPTLRVGLAAPDQSPLAQRFWGLIDTGADGTFVPTILLEELDVPAVYFTNVRSHLFTGVRRVSIHKIDLVLDDIRLPSVQVVSDDSGEEIIIGRNVLNKLVLLLDGPKQLIEAS